MEVSVYGVTKETYERITRRPGSFDAFMRGLDLLLENNIRVRFKAMALRSNLHEMPEIARFCRERTRDYFRFDPMLHLRYDLDPVKNEEIMSELLSPEEIVELEYSDPERVQALEEKCDKFINPDLEKVTGSYVFTCGAGNSNFSVGWDGSFRLCLGLVHPDCIYDLRKGSLTDAWNNFIPRIRCIQSEREDFLKRCRTCSVINLCSWCPATAYLETGKLDMPVDRFCKIANARAKALTQRLELKAQSDSLEV
jgi:radical SAM protein with 4Fe4S-binding SPASM domain